MGKRYINTDDTVIALIDRIASNPDGFEHLKIFIKRDDLSTCFENTEYLMVTPTVFKKVQLLDVDVEDNFIILTILDCSTDLLANVGIDTNNKKVQTIFIRWSDIRKMVMQETFSRINKDDLLDFDF